MHHGLVRFITYCGPGCSGLSQRDVALMTAGYAMATHGPSEIYIPEPVPACVDPTAGDDEWEIPGGGWVQVHESWEPSVCVDPRAPVRDMMLLGPTCGGGE